MASKKVNTEEVTEVKEEAVQETNKAEAQVAPAAEVPNVPAPVAEPKKSLGQRFVGAVKAAPKKLGEAIEKHPKIAAGTALVLGIGAGYLYEKNKADKEISGLQTLLAASETEDDTPVTTENDYDSESYDDDYDLTDGNVIDTEIVSEENVQ